MELTEKEKSESCVRRFQEGDRRAFDELVQIHKRKAYGFVVGMMGHRQDAEDILQEGFLKAYDGLADFRAEASFKTWLYRILINLTRDRLRRNARTRRIFSLSMDEPDLEGRAKEFADRGPSPAEQAQEKDMQKALEEAVSFLSDRQKEVFSLRYFQGLKTGEISSILGCSTATVKVHMFRAVREVGRHLQAFREKQEKMI